MNTNEEFARRARRRSGPGLAKVTCGLVTIAALFSTSRLEAVTVTFDPVADNWINSCASSAEANYGDDLELRVRTASLWGDIKNFRSLLRFDLSESQVEGSWVTNATLGLYYYTYHYGDPAGRIYAVHRVTSSWEEMGSTWYARSGQGTPDPVYWDSYWAGAPPYRPGGGDFDTNGYAFAEVPAAPGEWITWDVTELVRDWLDESHPNDGLLIKDTDEFEEDPGADVSYGPAQFSSIDYWNEAEWPYIEVTYRVPGDFDDDGDVDLDDFANWDACATGPGQGSCADECCAFDFDGDDDVDLHDFAALQATTSP